MDIKVIPRVSWLAIIQARKNSELLCGQNVCSEPAWPWGVGVWPRAVAGAVTTNSAAGYWPHRNQCLTQIKQENLSVSPYIEVVQIRPIFLSRTCTMNV